MVGRALIGLGVALALMAGFKAIVLWFPAERLALVNGWFVMLGALGAVDGHGAGRVRRAGGGLARPVCRAWCTQRASRHC